MIRRFYLENEYGENYYFDYRNQTLLSEVNGIGFSLNLKYLNYGNLYKKYESKLPLTEIQETLIFLNGYKGYKKFIDYLSKTNKEYKLYYETSEFKAFCLVDISSLTKGQLIAGTIQSKITFKRLSSWLKEKSYTINASGINAGKVYPYSYPYSYSKSYAGKISIENKGLDKAPIIIEIIGDVINPEIYIKKDNEIISTMRLYLEGSSVRIIINSMPFKQEMSLIENETRTDIYSLQDFEEDNFLFLDHGNYEIEFKPGVSSESICKLTLVESYLGI